MSLYKTNETYWQALERAEKSKKARRLLIKQAKEQKSSRDKLIKEVLEENGHTYITSILDTDKHKLVISYISDKKVDLLPEMRYLS